MVHSKTILIGHSLESDLKALKIIHSMVVDTSVLYPHNEGPPYKRRLKALCLDNLKLDIQKDGKSKNFDSFRNISFELLPVFLLNIGVGHSSLEDANACIDLVLHYVRNRH